MRLLSFDEVAREVSVGGRVVRPSTVASWVRTGIAPRSRGGRGLRATGKRIRLRAVAVPGRRGVTPQDLAEFLSALNGRRDAARCAEPVRRAMPDEVGTYPVVRVPIVHDGAGRELG